VASCAIIATCWNACNYRSLLRAVIAHETMALVTGLIAYSEDRNFRTKRSNRVIRFSKVRVRVRVIGIWLGIR